MAKHDETAFEALVERRSRFAYRVAYAVLRNSHDAEDVVQETFLKLYKNRSWHDLRDEAAFVARVTWRVAVDKLVARSRSGVAHDEEPVSRDADPEQAAVDAHWRLSIHHLIDALPEELRQPLILSAIEELNSRQVAEILGIAEGTVRTRLQRARQLLKQKISITMESRYGR